MSANKINKNRNTARAAGACGTASQYGVRSTIYRTIRRSVIAGATVALVAASMAVSGARADIPFAGYGAAARSQPVAFIVPNHWQYPGQFSEEAAPSPRRAAVSRDPQGRVLRGGEAGTISGLAGPVVPVKHTVLIGLVSTLFLAMAAAVAMMWRRLARSVAPTRRSWEDWN